MPAVTTPSVVPTVADDDIRPAIIIVITSAAAVVAAVVIVVRAGRTKIDAYARPGRRRIRPAPWPVQPLLLEALL